MCVLEFLSCCPSGVQFFAQFQGVLPYECIYRYSVKSNKQTQCRSLEIFLYVATSSLLHEFQRPQLLQILTSVSLTQLTHGARTGLSLPVSGPRKCLPTESQDDHRTQLVCFCSFRDQTPLLPIDQCGESYLTWDVSLLFSFLVVCGICREGANPVPVTRSWPDPDSLQTIRN